MNALKIDKARFTPVDLEQGSALLHVLALDEREARQREEELWMEFIRNSRVDGGFGMAYLRELQARK